MGSSVQREPGLLSQSDSSPG